MSRPPIPRYEILGELNRGGMGIVYRAWDPQLGREVALKVLLDPGGAPAEARERFLQEAQLAARLVHPHIVPVYDTGEHLDQVFLAMQLIDGTGLDKAKLDLRAAVGLLRDAARAVHYAHEQGVIHRDLKPSNLMVDRKGRVFVTDFGLARRSDATAKLTLSGTVLGTPVYMPPEQARGMPTDARSDVYSLGATLYEVLSGQPPFSGPNELEILKKVHLDEPLPPRSHNPAIPRDVEAIILKAMDKKASGRYATAAELADDLQRFLDGEAVRAPTRGFFYRTRKKIVRHRWRVLAAASLLALLAGGLVTGWTWLDAREKFRRAMEEQDTAVRKELLRDAAKWIAAARAEIVRIEREEQRASDEIARKNADHEARERNHAQIDGLKLEGRRAIADRNVVRATRPLETLRTLDPSAAADLEVQIRELEFDLGVGELQGLADRSEADPFRVLFVRLESPLYRSQRDRDGRLGRPALSLGLELMKAKEPRAGDAVPWFNKAGTLGVHDWKLYEQRGLAHISLGAWDLAEKDLREFRSRAPRTEATPVRFADLWVHKAREAMKRDQPAEALLHLNEAIQLDGTHATALHHNGLARYRTRGLAREALDDLDLALQHDPRLVPDREYAAVALAWTREVVAKHLDLDEAKAREAAWTDAVRRLSVLAGRLATLDRPGVLLERARMHRRLGKTAEAFEDAEQAGDSAESFLIRAQVRYLGGRMEEAHALADRAAAADPKSPRARYWRGTCGALTGKTAAAEDLKAACESGAFGGEPLHRLARLSLDRKDWVGTVAWATQALARAALFTEDERIVLLGEPRTVAIPAATARFRRDVHYTIARARFNQGDFAGCEASCTQAVGLDGSQGDAFYLRAFARYKQKRFAEAIEGFEEALKISPSDVDALLGRATALTSKGDWNEAIGDYTRVLTLHPRSAEALAGRGVAREAKGETAEAQRDYEEALRVAPQGWPHEAEIRKRLRKPE